MLKNVILHVNNFILKNTFLRYHYSKMIVLYILSGMSRVFFHLKQKEINMLLTIPGTLST